MRTPSYGRFLLPHLMLALAWALAPAAVEAQESGGTAQPAEMPQWDPLQAAKSVEVGTYYLRRGNYDAAIDRFQEAARLQPNLAIPHLKLGETYEKKNDLPKAVASYQKYLEVFKTAPDGNKIRKRIEELEKRIAREAGPEK
jgi:tetratricopeptide (TPR) repeat protein